MLPTQIYYDYESVTTISHNLIKNSKTKHIELRYHFIMDHIVIGNIGLMFVPQHEEIANIFTKSTWFN